MRITKVIDATVDQVESAKETAVALIGDNSSRNALDLFYTEDLSEVEDGIKRLNEFSSKSWLLSSILLYTLIYNKGFYEQSGLEWAEYAKQSRQRLGIDQRDITEQLSAARFFIRNHKALEKAGFNPLGSNAKLARAELALELTGSVDMVIEHIVSDTWRDFKEWYQSFKPSKSLPKPNECRRDDISFDDGRFTIGGVDAVTVSDRIPEADRQRLLGYLSTIFKSMALGYEPAIIPVYDKKEAAIMPRLRDKFRQGK